MVRRVVRSMTAMLVLAVVLQGGVALADEHESIEATYCVTETTFEFVVVRRGLSVDTASESMFINADGRWNNVTGPEATHQIWVQYGFDAGEGPIIVRSSGRTIWYIKQNVEPPVRWQQPATNVGTVTAVEVSTGVWDVTYQGSVPNGVDTWWTASAGAPPASYGDLRQTAVAAGNNMDLEIESTPVTPCATPPPTTVPPTTVPPTTVPPTTVPPTTVPPTVAPTSVVSTTLPATTTIPEVETDIANSDGATRAVPVLIAVGFLALAGAAVRARRIER